ncbi:MAG: VWA domain-containing protein [Candidatus Eremiobacteraeota bacterium]|nr:VWA domain-containing protein [Candidatus Eremiobacteraeota bacterium]
MNNIIELKAELSQNIMEIKNSAQTIYALIRLKPIEFDEGEKLPLDLRMVLDRSGSMFAPVGKFSNKSRLDVLKSACLETVRRLEDGDRLTIYTFCERSKMELKPTVVKNKKDKSRMIKSINNINYGGGTHLSTSLDHMLNLKPIDNNCLQRAIVFTDGEVNTPSRKSEESICTKIAKRARKSGTPFWVYGTGIDYAEDFLTDLARESGGHYEHIGNAKDITAVFSDQVSYFQDVVITNAEITIEAEPGVMFRKISRVIPDIERYTNFQPTYFSTPLPDLDKSRGTAILLRLDIVPVFNGLSRIATARVKFDAYALGIMGMERSIDIKIDFTNDSSLIKQNQQVLDIVTLNGAHTLATLGTEQVATGNIRQGTEMMDRAADLYQKVGVKDISTKLMTLSNTAKKKGNLAGDDLNTRRTLTTASAKLITKQITNERK